MSNGASLDTTVAGDKTFTVQAADAAGNTTAMTRGYHVGYRFVGVAQPADNLPVVNLANAGRTIPLKWRLENANGAPVASLATFQSLGSAPAACGGGLLDDIEETATTGGTVLRYDAAAGQFIYNWATSASWKGQCRSVVLKLADGQTHELMFRFK